VVHQHLSTGFMVICTSVIYAVQFGSQIQIERKEGWMKLIKRLWCIYFHKKYHTKYIDKGSTGIQFTILECLKCRKHRIFN
jgi:hypothetical protein